MTGVRILLVVLATLLAAAPASALPDMIEADPNAPLLGGGEGTESRTSCAVTAVDGSGSGVQPFVDSAALGARVGTPVGSYTVAVYPYSCSSVVLQIADPNDDVPRGVILPEDMPFAELLKTVLG